MKKTVYPTLEEVLHLHWMLIDTFGGSHGVLDLGLLESALGRARSGYYETLMHQAAALLHSLINNHCFVDGNKRVAFALTATFLKMNGYDLHIRTDPAEKFILNDIIERKADVNAIAFWLNKHVVKVTR